MEDEEIDQDLDELISQEEVEDHESDEDHQYSDEDKSEEE